MTRDNVLRRYYPKSDSIFILNVKLYESIKHRSMVYRGVFGNRFSPQVFFPFFLFNAIVSLIIELI